MTCQTTGLIQATKELALVECRTGAETYKSYWNRSLQAANAVNVIGESLEGCDLQRRNRGFNKLLLVHGCRGECWFVGDDSLLVYHRWVLRNPHILVRSFSGCSMIGSELESYINSYDCQRLRSLPWNYLPLWWVTLTYDLVPYFWVGLVVDGIEMTSISGIWMPLSFVKW